MFHAFNLTRVLTMTRRIGTGLAVCLLSGLIAVHAQAQPVETRGEMLYAKHCNVCHTKQVHWRNKKIATDWNSLVAQVRRWQGNAGLRWTDEEINDVAHYLDSAYYRFAAGGKPGVDKKSR